MAIGLELVARLLSAQLLVAAAFYSSWALACWALPSTSRALRWSAASLVGMWLCSAGFHALLVIHQFTLAAGLLGAGACAFLARWLTGAEPSALARQLGDDLRAAIRAFADEHIAVRALALVLGVAVVATLARAALIPPLGWDALTYHATKAAMWVQSGAPLQLDAPGNWAAQRLLAGGGELFMAWAMLPLSSGDLVGLVEGLQWLLIGTAVYALACELRVLDPYRWLAVVYVLFLPSVWLSVGKGYIDLVLTLSLLQAVLFGLHYERTGRRAALVLALLALGLAAGIKVTALPIAGLGFAVLAFRACRAAPRDIGALVLGAAGALAVSLPWLIWTAIESGYPLTPFDVSVAGVRLGVTLPMVRAALEIPNPQGYQLGPELAAMMKRVFVLPWEQTRYISSHISAASLLPIAVFVPAISGLWRRRPLAALMILAVIVPMVAFIVSPTFTHLRMRYEWGRFVLPALAVVVVVTSPRPSWPSWWRHGYSAVLGLAVLTHVAVGARYGWASFENWALPVVAAAGLALAAAIFWLSQMASKLRGPKGALCIGAGVLITTAALGGLVALEAATLREAIRDSVMGFPSPRYWAPAARLLDQRDRSLRVAVTSGAVRPGKGNVWPIYYLMGSRFQNTIVYVPITASGEFVELLTSADRGRHGSFEAWLRRLRSEGVTHVVSFMPRGVELNWMSAYATIFEKLAGDQKSAYWGLYAVKLDEVADAAHPGARATLPRTMTSSNGR